MKYKFASLATFKSKYLLKSQKTWFLIFENNVNVKRIYVMKILPVFPNFSWVNKSYYLITYNLTWKKLFSNFLFTIGTSIRRVSEHFW